VVNGTALERGSARPGSGKASEGSMELFLKINDDDYVDDVDA